MDTLQAEGGRRFGGRFAASAAGAGEDWAGCEADGGCESEMGRGGCDRADAAVGGSGLVVDGGADESGRCAGACADPARDGSTDCDGRTLPESRDVQAAAAGGGD